MSFGCLDSCPIQKFAQKAIIFYLALISFSRNSFSPPKALCKIMKNAPVFTAYFIAKLFYFCWWAARVVFSMELFIPHTNGLAVRAFEI